MRQGGLLVTGLALVAAGIIVSVGSDIAARNLAPAAAHAPVDGRLHMPAHYRDGGGPPGGQFPGRIHNGGPGFGGQEGQVP
ncbi:MAG TPA: hypothetical protein VFL29_14900 [Candidatus Dormibacteraeota bacterium]|nr:hypothetical protein [Candidatus Dormibacteraeota bacterium]